MPPPEPLQADSPRMPPDGSSARVVPPTDRTLGDVAGYEAGAPRSPAAATNVTPAWPAGVVKLLSYPDSPKNSLPPQLIETAATPGCWAAYRTAVARLLKELSFASTSKMLAPG